MLIKFEKHRMWIDKPLLLGTSLNLVLGFLAASMKREITQFSLQEKRQTSSLRKAKLSLALHFHWGIHLGDTGY